MNEDLRQADAIIFGAPVYIGYWSGQAKNFIDRWYCFRSRTAYHFPPVRRAVMACTCGAGAESYQALLDKQVSWMSDRLGMETRGLMAASLSGKDAAAAGRAELMSEAREMGLWLAQG